VDSNFHTQDSEAFEEAPRRPITNNNKALPILLGITLGVGVAIWLFLSREPSPEHLEPIEQTSPVTATIVQPEIATPSPTVPTTPELLPSPSPSIPTPILETATPVTVAEENTPQKPTGHGRKPKSAGIKPNTMGTKPVESLPTQPVKAIPQTPRELKPFPTL
jgi:hypothetical protein